MRHERSEGERVSRLEDWLGRNHGTPGGIRTHDPRLRRPLLYPTELRAPMRRRMLAQPGGLKSPRWLAGVFRCRHAPSLLSRDGFTFRVSRVPCPCHRPCHRFRPPPECRARECLRDSSVPLRRSTPLFLR